MSVIYIMIPVALLLATAGVLSFIWAVRDGQYDDVDSHACRILFDDPPVEASNNTSPQTSPSATAK